MKKLITKGDIALLLTFLFAVALIIGIPAVRSAAAAQTQEEAVYLVEVCVNGEVYGTYSLAEDRSITVSNDYGTNVIVIEDGAVYMEESDCRNQVCVNTGTIHTQGQIIICLPHLLSAEIIAGDGTEETFDAISR